VESEVFLTLDYKIQPCSIPPATDKGKAEFERIMTFERLKAKF
jgi:hypothetical protein